MDEQLEILLHQYQNIASVNVDGFNKIELSNNLTEINEYDIRNVLSATEVFDVEREANSIYRIYGRIEFMSILNGLKNNYSQFQDFFTPQYTGNSKNILNSFDFYLVRPSESGYVHIITGTTTNNSTITYNRFFTVVATPNQFELFPIGFSNNVFGEQGYSYNFNVDIDISNLYDQFGFPITELFLYAQYKKSTTPNPIEILAAKQWTNTGIVSKPAVTTTTLKIGYTVSATTSQKFGDIIDYSKLDYLQVQLQPEQFYITTPYSGGKRLIWKYNPFIPLRLRYLSSSLYTANISGTSYAEVQSIPVYATSTGGGNYVWRDIMAEGYTDPLTGIGTDNPFINKRRYLFTPIVLDIQPDLDDAQTLAAFEEVWFARNSYKLNITPIGDIENIGKPCQ